MRNRRSRLIPQRKPFELWGFVAALATTGLVAGASASPPALALDGGASVLFDQSISNTEITISGDGSRVVIVSYREPDNANPEEYIPPVASELVVLDPTGATPEQRISLEATSPNPGGGLALSEDGTTGVFYGRDGFVRVDLDSGSLEVLGRPEVYQIQLEAIGFLPDTPPLALSPDGSTLLYGAIDSTIAQFGLPAVGLIDLDEPFANQTGGLSVAGAVRGFGFSPDGLSVWVHSRLEDQDPTGLRGFEEPVDHVLTLGTLDGGQPPLETTLGRFAFQEPDILGFSADSSHVVMSQYSGDDQGFTGFDIDTVDLATGEQSDWISQQLPQDVFDEGLDSTEDGRSFLLSGGQIFELFFDEQRLEELILDDSDGIFPTALEIDSAGNNLTLVTTDYIVEEQTDSQQFDEEFSDFDVPQSIQISAAVRPLPGASLFHITRGDSLLLDSQSPTSWVISSPSATPWSSATGFGPRLELRGPSEDSRGPTSFSFLYPHGLSDNSALVTFERFTLGTNDDEFEYSTDLAEISLDTGEVIASTTLAGSVGAMVADRSRGEVFFSFESDTGEATAGLWRWQPGSTDPSPIGPPPQWAMPFEQFYPEQLQVAADGSLLMAAGEGLLRFDPDSGQWSGGIGFLAGPVALAPSGLAAMTFFSECYDSADQCSSELSFRTWSGSDFVDSGYLFSAPDWSIPSDGANPQFTFLPDVSSVLVFSGGTLEQRDAASGTLEQSVTLEGLPFSEATAMAIGPDADTLWLRGGSNTSYMVPISLGSLAWSEPADTDSEEPVAAPGSSDDTLPFSLSIGGVLWGLVAFSLLAAAAAVVMGRRAPSRVLTGWEAQNGGEAPSA